MGFVKLAPAAAGRPRGCEIEMRHTRLLDAAETEFRAYGLARASIDRMAATACVSKATFYRHYRDKADLFQAVAFRHMQNLVDRLPQLLDVTEDPREVLTAFARLLLDVTLGAPDETCFGVTQLRIMAAELPSLPDVVTSLQRRWRQLRQRRLADYFQEMKEAGRLRIDDVEWAEQAFMRVAVPHIQMLTTSDFRMSPEERDVFARMTAGIFLDGILA
ncbi:MAG: TetR/AcrR family transcriptional regulator [Caulobacteraceae bacterium]|nr:TetR/AcrR family transcriptional regulator [Caulobacteraceae bacterium]